MVYVLIYILIETLVTINLATKIGAFATFLEIVISALIGIFLLTYFRFTLANNAMMLLSKEIDMDEFLKLNLYSFIGAILLIIPGFFSDIIGILLQFGYFGNLFAKLFFKNKTKPINKFKKGDGCDEVIDVEIVDSKRIIE